MYRVQQVEAEAQLREWFLIRQSVYLAEELLSSNEVGQTVYTDAYDRYSKHYLVRDTSGLGVASARLILRDGADQPLQVEDQFDLKVQARSAEISGFAIMPKHRGGLAAVALIRALLEETRHQGIEDVYAEVEPWFFGALVRFGYPVVQISETRFVYNAENLVFRVATSEFWETVEHASAERHANLMGTYYSHPWEWDIDSRHLHHANGPSV